jgi:hypothetical protein
MRGWIGVLALVAVLAGVALGGSEPANGSCAPVLKWRGHLYEGFGPVDNPDALQVGPRLSRKAKDPPCIDTFPAPKPRPKAARVVVRQYVGVPPQLGLSWLGSLYLAAGYFPQLPGHPLHAALYGTDPGEPDGTSHARCGGTHMIEGRVTGSGPYNSSIDPTGKKRRLFLEVDAQTRIIGLSRYGYPFLRRGERIEVTGLACRAKNFDPGHYVVPRLISPRS